MIARENTQRRVAILVNVRGRDTAGFVQEATAKLRERVNFAVVSSSSRPAQDGDDELKLTARAYDRILKAARPSRTWRPPKNSQRSKFPKPSSIVR